MGNKTLIPTLTAGCLLLALGVPALAATQVNTSTAIGITPNPVVESNPATLTGTLTTQGSPSSTWNGADMAIQRATNNGLIPTDARNPLGIAIGDPVGCGFGGEAGQSGNSPHITWVNVASGTTSGAGAFSTTFGTTGLGGKTIGFRADHDNQTIGGNHLRKSTSPCADLVIQSAPSGPGACTPGASIAATLASGDGTPPPGSSGPWTFRITVTACGPLTGVTAQGGANGWAPVTNAVPSSGTTVDVRKATNKNTIHLWTIGNMADGQTADLDVTVSGTIPATAPDCQLRYLSGPWSASYTLPMATTRTKSGYSGRVTITVDDPAVSTCP